MVRKRLSNFVTTFAGLLGTAEMTVDVSAQLEGIRHAMLSCLSEIPAGTLGLDKTWGAIVGILVDRDHPFRFIVTTDSG